MTRQPLPAKTLAAVLTVVLTATPVPAGPTTLPSAARERIGRWLTMLADPEPTVREEARVALMGLQPGELSLLHEVAIAAKPLRPGSALPLREVVTYVIARALLAREPTNGQGLLGVRWLARDADMIGVDPSDTAEPGVPIDLRLPGFVASRYLQQGDLILGEAVRGRLRATCTRTDLQALVRDHQAGDAVTLVVRRAGRTIVIRLALDAHPVVANGPGDEGRFDQVLYDATVAAEDYFQREFGDLLPDDGDA